MIAISCFALAIAARYSAGKANSNPDIRKVVPGNDSKPNTLIDGAPATVLGQNFLDGFDSTSTSSVNSTNEKSSTEADVDRFLKKEDLHRSLAEQLFGYTDKLGHTDNRTPYTIHPRSTFTNTWILVSGVFIVIYAIFLPFQVR
jgi:hypothetical protein